MVERSATTGTGIVDFSRPGRDAVRVEVERFRGVKIVHNYGHGGCGVALSWGCATEAAGLARG